MPPIWDCTVLSVTTPIGRAADVTLAGVHHPLQRLWDVTLAGVQTPIWAGEISVTDILNTQNWSDFNDIAASNYIIRGAKENSPWSDVYTDQYNHCLRAIGAGSSVRAHKSMSGSYYCHFALGDFFDEKGRGLLRLRNANQDYYLWQPTAYGSGVQHISQIITLPANTYTLEFLCEEGQNRLWQADIINVTEMLNMGLSQAQVLQKCDEQCRGKNGTYTISI